METKTLTIHGKFFELEFRRATVNVEQNSKSLAELSSLIIASLIQPLLNHKGAQHSLLRNKQEVKRVIFIVHNPSEGMYICIFELAQTIHRAYPNKQFTSEGTFTISKVGKGFSLQTLLKRFPLHQQVEVQHWRRKKAPNPCSKMEIETPALTSNPQQCIATINIPVLIPREGSDSMETFKGIPCTNGTFLSDFSSTNMSSTEIDSLKQEMAKLQLLKDDQNLKHTEEIERLKIYKDIEHANEIQKLNTTLRQEMFSLTAELKEELRVLHKICESLKYENIGLQDKCRRLELENREVKQICSRSLESKGSGSTLEKMKSKIISGAEKKFLSPSRSLIEENLSVNLQGETLITQSNEEQELTKNFDNGEHSRTSVITISSGTNEVDSFQNKQNPYERLFTPYPGSFQWLDDIIINDYIATKYSDLLKDICIFNTYFMANVEKGIIKSREWTKYVITKRTCEISNLSEHSVLILPINCYEGAHWALLCLLNPANLYSSKSCQPATFLYLDSFYDKMDKSYDISIVNFLMSLSKQGNKQPNHKLIIPHTMAKQNNNSACGYFILYLIDLIVKDPKLLFDSNGRKCLKYLNTQEVQLKMHKLISQTLLV
jgi:hypothetical protein